MIAILIFHFIMNKNGTDLTAKIEDLKQRALKSGNTFVVDMINSNKNPNDLFFENMNKMMNKGSYHGENGNQNTHPKVNATVKTLTLDTESKYVIFNNYKDVNGFFLYEDKLNNYIQPCNFEINKHIFNGYLNKKIFELFNNEVYNIYDIEYINILLNESNKELKSKIKDILITSYYENSKFSKKLGNKLRNIVSKCRVFVELIYYIYIDYIKIDYDNVNHTFSFLLSFNNKQYDISLITYDEYMLTSSETNDQIISKALNNKNVYRNYLHYLSSVIIDDLLFSNINYDVLNNSIFDDSEKDEIIQNNIIQLATFILTTCLFIGKKYADKEK